MCDVQMRGTEPYHSRLHRYADQLAVRDRDLHDTLLVDLRIYVPRFCDNANDCNSLTHGISISKMLVCCCCRCRVCEERQAREK